MPFARQGWLVVATSKILVITLRVNINRRGGDIATIWIEIAGFFHRAVHATVNGFDIVVVGAIANQVGHRKARPRYQRTFATIFFLVVEKWM